MNTVNGKTLTPNQTRLYTKIIQDCEVTKTDVESLELFNPFYISKLMQLSQEDLKLKLLEAFNRHSVILFEPKRRVAHA